MGLGKYKEALYDFSVAIQLEKRLDDQADKKKMSDAYCYAGQCHFEMEQFDMALAHLEKACLFERENGRNLFYRALAKSRMANGVRQKYEDANEDFKFAFKEFQNDVTTKFFIRFNMGINLRLLQKYEESADMLRQAIEL
jgi:tetratricopeptide (TPR) repeat protein